VQRQRTVVGEQLADYMGGWNWTLLEYRPTLGQERLREESNSVFSSNKRKEKDSMPITIRPQKNVPLERLRE